MQSAATLDKKFLKTVLSLALPIAVQNLINFMLNMIDIIMLGSFGEDAISSVGVASTPFFIMQLVIFGFVSGSSVLISQYWGKKDLSSINKIIGITLFSCVSVAAVASTFIFLFPRFTVSIVTNQPQLIDLGAKYAKIVSFSFVFAAFSSVLTGANRSMENAKMGMYIHGSAILANTFLNWVLIFGNLGAPKMGVEGAALATLFARIFELAFAIFYTQKINRHFHVNFRQMLRPPKELVSDFIKYASPVIINETLWGTGFAMYSLVYGRMGSDIVAANIIAGNIERVVAVFAFGLANGASILVGKEIGVGNIKKGMENAAKILKLSFIYGFIILAIILLILPFIFTLFSVKSSTVSMSRYMLMLIALLSPLRYYNMTLVVGVLRGGGDARYAMLVDISALWLLSVPLVAFTALVLKWPIWYVYPFVLMDEIVKFILGYTRFKSNVWVKNVTRDF